MIMFSRHSLNGQIPNRYVFTVCLLCLFSPAALAFGHARGPLLSQAVTAGREQYAATATDPELAQARLLVGRGRLDDAEHLVWPYLQRHPHSAAAHFLLGYILFRQIQAKALLDARSPGAVYQTPDESEVKFRDTNAKASLVEYTEGAKYQRPSAFDLKIVALDYVLLGDYLDADKWLTRSLQWNPKDSESWYYLGRAKYNENRFAEAVAAFKHCLKLDEKNAKAEDNLGLSYAGLGRNDDAVAAYETAIGWQSGSLTKDPEPFIDLGSLYLDLNQPDKAIPFLLQSVQISSQISRAHEQLGRAYLLANQLPKAQNQLETAVALSPQTARLHYILGQIYRKRGLTAKAKVEFDRCIALQRAHPTDSSTM
jgi:tetratricopeptide (TPR) repeat protein